MTLDETQEAEIRRLHFAEHWKVGTIVTQLGLHHDVVERVLGLGEGARSRAPVLPKDALVAAIQVPAPLRGYEAFVTETLTQYPRLRATRLYDMLVERGYKGSTRTVRRHVRRNTSPCPVRTVARRSATRAIVEAGRRATPIVAAPGASLGRARSAEVGARITAPSRRKRALTQRRSCSHQRG